MKKTALFLKSLCSDERGLIVASVGIIFASLLIFFLIPRTFPNSTPGSSTSGGQTTCTLGQPPSDTSPILMPTINGLNDDPGISEGGPVEDQLVEFVKIRENVVMENVGVFFKAENDSPPNEHTFKVNVPSMPQYRMYYPGRWNHFELYREFEAPYTNISQPGKYNNVSLRNEGIVIGVRLRDDGQESDETRPDGDGVEHPVKIVDFFQIKSIADAPKDFTMDELFRCQNGGGDSGILVPAQNKSRENDQLQLEWFLFGKSTNSAPPVMAITCKPAVYLYPPHKQLVNVKVFPTGTLIYTDPIYDNKTGWTVEANPDGLLSTTYSLQPKTYPYLYYESKIKDEVIRKPTKGWVIASQITNTTNSQYPIPNDWFTPLEKHFNEVLPQLGLNGQQTKDFIDYWKTTLEPAPYYFVGIVDPENVDQFERLEIIPQPDSVNRVRIYFEKLTEPKIVEAPHLPSTTSSVQPTTFSVVEWGGMVKNDREHPFTCSQ